MPDARVVKAFNTTFAGTLVEGQVAGQPLDVFMAGDDEGAKDAVKQLAGDGGLRSIDVGPLALAHHVEARGYLNMAIRPSLGTNYQSAIKIVAWSAPGASLAQRNAGRSMRGFPSRRTRARSVSEPPAACTARMRVLADSPHRGRGPPCFT